MNDHVISGTGSDESLIAVWLDGRLAAATSFEQRLVAEPALARKAAAYLLLEVELYDRLPEAASSSAVRRTSSRRTSPPQRSKSIARKQMTWPGIVSAAAAALVAVAVLVTWPGRPAVPAQIGPEVDLVMMSSAPGAVSVDGVSTSATVLRSGQILRARTAVTLRWRGEATEVTVAPTTDPQFGGEVVVRLQEHGLQLDAGSANAVVAPRGGDRAFRITAGAAQATVLGTRFHLERQGQRTLLTVISGRVELRQGTATREVGAGDSAIADSSGVVPGGVVAAVELDRGLLARWSGEGLSGNRLSDLGPGARHGDATGVQAISGRLSKALHFAGENSLVTIPHHDDLTIGDPAKSFSVALWLRVPVGGTHEQSLISKGRTTAQPGPTVAMCLALSGGDHIDLYRWHDGPVPGAQSMESSGWRLGHLDDGTWHHVAVVCENAALRRCYHQGTEVGVDTTQWRNDTRNRTRWALGRLENMGFTKETPLTGDLEDVRLYDRILSAAEVIALATKPPAIGR